jgi:biotin synthase
VRAAGINVCSGGIVGMGESAPRARRPARAAGQPRSVSGVGADQRAGAVEGTPMADEKPLDPLEFVRTIAVARITMPLARVRLSAGRQQMSEAVQALCFLAGANSVFYGEKLLTTGNPDVEKDRALFGYRRRIQHGR